MHVLELRSHGGIRSLGFDEQPENLRGRDRIVEFGLKDMTIAFHNISDFSTTTIQAVSSQK